MSDSTEWIVFVFLSVMALVCTALWIKYLPKFRMYKRKASILSGINRKYTELCRRRRDLVYHFFWSVDGGEMRQADEHERDVLGIDEELKTLRQKYDDVERSGVL